MPFLSRQRHTVPAYVSPQLGLEAVSVEQLIHGHASIGPRFAALVRAARLLGDAAMEARLMGPRRAALADLPVQPLDGTLIRTGTAADLREDQSRTAFPCALMENPPQARDKAQRWLDDMDVAMGRMVETRAAVVGSLKAGQ
jgi:hypothetical protein